MVSEKKKLNRVINFLKKGLEGLADELEGTVKGINDFIDSLKKAQKDLKEIPAELELKTESTSSKKVAAANIGTVKTAAASTLFNLLSSSGGGVETSTAAVSAAGTPSGGPPTAPPGGGPPKAPPGGGPPKAPPGGGPPAGSPARPAAAAQAGGGLGSLRDEMLEELTRLKKIMRGE